MDHLLQTGANVHTRDDGGLIPLHNACSFGHSEVRLNTGTFQADLFVLFLSLCIIFRMDYIVSQLFHCAVVISTKPEVKLNIIQPV